MPQRRIIIRLYKIIAHQIFYITAMANETAQLFDSGPAVVHFINGLFDKNKECEFENVELNQESESLDDCQHIAMATINKVDILASWNFKHIVNINRIRGYNGVDLKKGYATLEIRNPRELIDYEN